jgi:alkylation response protein AidB-like acyl-CoA dehydrogenase
VTTYAPVDKQQERLQIAREVGQIINRDAEASSAQGTLTGDSVAALLQSGLIKMGVALEVGGEQCTYTEWAEVIEELARSDGSAAWCTMAVSSHAAAFSAVLPDGGVKDLYGTATPVIAGMPAPRGRAERVENGYMFEGKHQFASGSMLADHFVAGGLVYKDGTLVMAGNGLPEMVAVIVPREQVRETGNWDVSGLEATASIDYEVGPMFVPDEFIVQVNPWVAKVYRGTSFWALGVAILGPLGHCPVGLGVSLRALQEISALAPTRQRRDGPYAAVGDQPHFRHELVARYAELQAARQLYYNDLLTRLDDWTLNHDTPAPPELVDRAKYVARYVFDVAIHVVDFAFEWSGSSGIRKSGVIGRAFRNVHAMNQHIAVDRHNYIDAAATVMPALAAGARDFAKG